LSGATGAMIFFALGLAFAEVLNIGQDWRKILVLTASFAVAFGSTFGSIGSGIEVFRKSYQGKAKAWDWISLGISIVTTIVGMVMGFAALLGATEEWSRIATIYGCIVVGGFAALDSSGDMIELGGLFGSYEDRFADWLAERQEHMAESDRAMDRKLADLETKIDQLAARWTWPVASKSDFETIVAKVNGDGAQLDRRSALLLLTKNQLTAPSDTTLARWIRTAKGD
jgi:hypothetical protein